MRIASLLLLLTSLFAQPAPKLADIEPVLVKIAAWDPAQPRDPLFEFTNFLRESMSLKSELPRIETRLLRMLASGATTTPAGKEFVCRQLSLIGTEVSVPALARLMKDPATAEIARYTLARIPGSAAGAALLDALPRASGNGLTGIANALGERRDTQAVPALRTLLGSRDPAAFEAALVALAQIGDRTSLAAIESALTPTTGGRHDSVLRAYIRCADAVAAAGDRAAAEGVYRRLAAPSEPAGIRVAVFNGLAAVNRAAAMPLLEKELASSDSETQAAAIRLLDTPVLAKHFPQMPPLAQIRVLAAMGERGDAAALPLANSAAQSATPEVRAAAVQALGRLGNPDSVALLAERAAAAPPGEQAAARESLIILHGPGVDDSITSGITSSPGPVQLELIRAAGERGSPQFTGVLMKVAQGTDRAASQAAIRAVRSTAGPEQAPALLATVLRIANANERREAALTLASVIKRAAKPEIEPVLAAFQSAPDKPVKLALIDVMGQVSADGALPILRAALHDSDPEIARAAILALTAWATPEPLPDLLDLARHDANPTRQILALRGYIRLMGTPSDRAPADSVAMLKQVWPLAKQAPEKRAILAQLQLYPVPEALKMAEMTAADAEITKEARAAADTLRASGVQ